MLTDLLYFILKISRRFQFHCFTPCLSQSVPAFRYNRTKVNSGGAQVSENEMGQS